MTIAPSTKHNDSARTPTQPVSIQRIALALTLLLWLVWPTATLAGLTLTYLAGVVIAAAVVRWRWFATLHPAGAAARWRWAATAAIGVVAVVRLGPGLVENEKLHVLSEHVGDRSALLESPAIHPRVLRPDRPQRFHIVAPPGARVAARMGAGSEPIEAMDLGHGLFRIDTPPMPEAIPATRDGHAEVTIFVDGAAHRKRVRFHQPYARPQWLTASAERGIAATASVSTHEVIVFDRSGNHHRVATAAGPSDCVMVNGGRFLIVCHRYAPCVSVIDLTGDRPRVAGRIDAPAHANRIAASSDGRRAAVTIGGDRPGLQVLEVGDEEVTVGPFVAMSVEPECISFGLNADEVIVSSRRGRALLRVVRRSTGRWAVDPRVLALSRPALGLCRSADGRRVHYTTTWADPSGDGFEAQGNHQIDDAIVTVDLDRWEQTDAIHTQRKSSLPTGAGELLHGISPMGLTAQDDGALLVACAGSNDLLRIEAVGREPRLRAITTEAPHDVADMGDGVRAVTSPATGVIDLYAELPVPFARVIVAPDDAGLASENPRALATRRGELAFYESTAAGLSCQSCHTHGDSDYARHNIGSHEMAATLSAMGVADTAPYLRDASYPRLRDLYAITTELFHGFPYDPGWNRGEAASAYIRSLTLPPPPDAIDGTTDTQMARQRRGHAVFIDAGCVHCHPPPAFTNLAHHPQHWLFPRSDRGAGPSPVLDTPSLVGLWRSAPFLHDGRAENLWTLLTTHNPGDRHGRTAHLTDTQRADLITFLKSL